MSTLAPAGSERDPRLDGERARWRAVIGPRPGSRRPGRPAMPFARPPLGLARTTRESRPSIVLSRSASVFISQSKSCSPPGLRVRRSPLCGWDRRLRQRPFQRSPDPSLPGHIPAHGVDALRQLVGDPQALRHPGPRSCARPEHGPPATSRRHPEPPSGRHPSGWPHHVGRKHVHGCARLELGPVDERENGPHLEPGRPLDGGGDVGAEAVGSSGSHDVLGRRGGPGGLWCTSKEPGTYQ
jgi:hypothetical protein